MTVSATVPRAQYTITSSNVTSLASDPASVTFNVTFKYLATSEVVATKTSSGTDTVLTETTHYTLSAAGASGTFTFTATGAALFAADDLLTFNRKMERTSDTFDQLSDYAQNDALDADTLENNFDKAIMISQQMKEAADRRLHFSATSTFETTGEAAAKIKATKADRASKYLGFDANGDITTLTSITGVTYTETSIAAGHILRYSGSAWVNSNILALDDTKLYFGTDSNISLEYDENGNDTLSFDGGDLLIEDDHKLYFGSGKDGYIEYDEDGNDTMVFGLPAGGGQILDDKPLYFGTNKDVLIEYDEAGDDTLLFQSLASTALNLGLYSSAGGANEDKWRISVADGGTMTFESKISGSWVAMMTLVPNGTATDSAITFAGDFTVSGDTTTVNTANLLVEDPLIVLSKNTTGGSPANDCGLIIERGDLSNTGIIWDESLDEFAFLSITTETGSTAGNINMGAYAPIKFSHIKGLANNTDITGTIDPAASTSVTGAGTAFLTEAKIGDQLLVTNETRTITAIDSNTGLTVDYAFTDNANDTTPEIHPASFVVLDDGGGIDFLVDTVGNIETSTTGKLKERGAFMQSSTNKALTLGY